MALPLDGCRLFLVDGTALAYRSHHALSRSRLATSEGRPTAATYGFATTMRALIEKEKPDRIVVAFDTDAETPRHKELPTYKATREKAPDEMVAQLDTIERVAAGFGAVVLKRDGVEADDLLATLARRAAAEGCDVYLVTADKDFAQLVGPKISMLIPSRLDQPEQRLDAAGVEQKFGVPPKHITDYLALLGDASDNIPGVKGVGEKTAAELVKKFGDVESLLARVGEIEKPKIREAVVAGTDALRLAKRLVTLDEAVPDLPAPSEIPPRREDVATLRDIYTENQFLHLLNRLSQEGAVVAPAASKPATRAKAPVTAAPEAGALPFAPPEEEAEPTSTATVPAGAVSALSETRTYVLVNDEAKLEEMLARLRKAKLVAFDTETTGIDAIGCGPVGLSLSIAPREAWYVPLCDSHGPPLPLAETVKRLKTVLEDPKIEKVAQNAKFDLLVLGELGIAVAPVTFDTMLASYCVAPNSRAHGLDALALRHLKLAMAPTITELIGTGKKQITMDKAPVERVKDYACLDADVTLRLVEPLTRDLELAHATKLFRDLEMPLLPVLTRMEKRGSKIDVGILGELGKTLIADEMRLEKEIHDLAGGAFKIGSVKELGAILFDRMRLHEAVGRRAPRRTKTGYATDADVLEELAAVAPIAAKILEYRLVTKLRNTYIETLPQLVNPKTGRVHTTFRQAVAATGRLSSDNPNLQNIPIRTATGRKIRRAFVPEPGSVLISADYSQIELRLVAHFSGDPVLVESFARGEDIHRRTAALVFGVAPEAVTSEMRSRAKAINFGIIYGMGAQRLARETGMSIPEAKQFIDAYFERLPRVRKFLDDTLKSAEEKGYAETLAGRRRPIPELASPEPMVRANAKNIAVNTPVQGSAADVIKRAMIDLDARLAKEGIGGGMILQVHDELVIEVKQEHLDRASAATRESMENAVKLSVPLKVDLGTGASWLDAHG